MASNLFLPFAPGSGANAISDAAYAADLAASGSLATGFVAGLAASAQVNKAHRQSSLMAAVLGQIIADYAGVDASDSETVAVLEAAFIQAITTSPAFSGTPTAPTAAGGTTTTQLGTTAFAIAAVEAMIVKSITGNVSTATAAGSQLGGAFSLPAGYTRAEIWGWAAGGGGSDCQATSLSGNAFGGGGGEGSKAHGIVTVGAGGTVTYTLGAPGIGNNNAAPTTLSYQGAVFLTLPGGQGGFFEAAGTCPGGAGGGAPSYSSIFSFRDGNGGSIGSDGQAGASALFAGNGAASPFGAGGRAGSQGGVTAVNSASGGGGAYDQLLSGRVFYGGAGGPAFLQWRALP